MVAHSRCHCFEISWRSLKPATRLERGSADYEAPRRNALRGLCLGCAYDETWRRSTLKTTLILLVGATGFEPATPCAQGRCATRLRYAPTLKILNFTPDFRSSPIRVLRFSDEDCPRTVPKPQFTVPEFARFIIPPVAELPLTRSPRD